MIDKQSKQISPLPKKKGEAKLMSFTDAIKEVVDGKKISKLEWGTNNIYGFLKNDILMLHGGKSGDGKDYNWTVNYGDLTGDDWFIMPEVSGIN